MNSNSNNSLRQRIVDATDIVSVISSYVTLTKKGANYIGLCPFHDDSNPSMSVNKDKKIFKCFSCNVGGDVVTFVSKIKNISTRDALRELGDSCGIKVQVTKQELEKQKNQKYYDIMKDAEDFYHFYLRNASDAKDAIDYIHGRGLNDDIIDKFHIGVSNDKDDLYKLLTSKGHLPVDMLEVGVIRSSFKDYHDTFKNRIIFPIWDLDGYVCGFSGRRYLEGDTDSKYMNTNETVIFKKGQILYNYHNAIGDIRKQDKCYLFEGFMDVIASVRSGVTNSVASMGTALTNNQIEAIKRLTNNIVVCYDSDEPGLNATLRAIEMLNQYDMNVSCVTIPDGKDADEYIKKNGNEALFNYLTNNQVSAMDFIYKQNLRTTILSDTVSKEEFKNNIFKNLVKFKSNSLVDTFINKLSNDLNVSLNSLNEDYESYKANYKENVLINDKINQNKNNNNSYNNTYKNIDNNNNSYNNYVNNFDGYDIPPEEENYNDSLNDLTDFNETKPKGKRIKLDDLTKYRNAEKALIIASYRDKEKCLFIEKQLNYALVDEISHNLLYKMMEYYKKHELIQDSDFKTKLNDDEIKLLDELLLKIKEKNEFVDMDISNNIKLVKEYPTLKTIEMIKEDNRPKSKDDIKSLSEMKRTTTRIIRKKK